MIQEHISLKKYNTLKLDVYTKYFVEVYTIEDLINVLSSEVAKSEHNLILGGGSNILFSKNYDGIVIKINIQGKRVIYEDEDSLHLEICAGEDWPTVVDYAVHNGWGGIENLALVPGTAGAAPLQNIACYGHNLSESLLSVETLDISNGTFKNFSKEACSLGYRTSIFKNEYAGKYIIVKIVLKLQKKPKLNTSYKSRYESIDDELSKLSSPPYTIRDVYQAVINIRKRKLPDVNLVGTVGSVFKNPLITRSQYEQLRNVCPGIHCYPEHNLVYDSTREQPDDSELVKIPAAWLIDEMGWAGKRIKHCGIWPTQPLNLVNYGDATPDEYLSFVNFVRDAVKRTYSVSLEPEVLIV